MEVALRAGYAPSEIVFTGVGKTPAGLERAVSLGLHAINAESSGEVERIASIARTLGTRARVALRDQPGRRRRYTSPHLDGLCRHQVRRDGRAGA